MLDTESVWGWQVSQEDVLPVKIHPMLLVCAVKKYISYEAMGRQELTNQVVMSFSAQKRAGGGAAHIERCQQRHLPGVKKCT